MSGMSVVTTAMAFSVSAFFVLFVFTRLLCARLHLSRAAAADRAAGDAFVVSAYNVERGIHGLEPSVVTTFPTVKLGDGGPQRPPVQEAQCPVCLEEYEAKDVVRVLQACGHAFHAPCIDAWLRQHPTCPICRASLRAKAGGGGGNRAAPPPDYSALVAGAAARAAPSHHVPAASSSDDAASPQAPDADGRLEIIIEEPASSPDGPSPAAAGAGAGRHSPCAEAAARQSASAAAGASSEHC
ncbi:putative RING-H2 finger protein ATL69 isoform X2 [Panicum virgatum]|nr:putative RING-H2 finger protein ATL69 isoform X2 [Panicum virgatum]